MRYLMISPLANWLLFIGAMVGCFALVVAVLVLAVGTLLDEYVPCITFDDRACEIVMSTGYISCVLGWSVCLVIMSIYTF
jgi:uncharacterized membrane protein